MKTQQLLCCLFLTSLINAQFNNIISIPDNLQDIIKGIGDGTGGGIGDGRGGGIGDGTGGGIGDGRGGGNGVDISFIPKNIT